MYLICQGNSCEVLVVQALIHSNKNVDRRWKYWKQASATLLFG
eukprot:CAMPEP_0117653242 /NCGR_PEP_ID=MMETSP0804-20121206/3080_1 /TAXON_ID=1074897 /ORGANISM="Tetraselmis astigmatica, Strain CCMP880" /LENGTH=42 /DNA_ID= /DNA_START= /DNA_END= /DNA_ORIENTATION=